MVAEEQMQKWTGRPGLTDRPYSNRAMTKNWGFFHFCWHLCWVWIRPWGEKEGKVQVPLAPTPSDSRRSASTCLSSKQAVEEASLWWRVRPVYVQVWAQLPVSLVDVDFFEALHFYHLQRVTRVFSPDLHWVTHLDHFQSTHTTHLYKAFTSITLHFTRVIPVSSSFS